MVISNMINGKLVGDKALEVVVGKTITSILGLEEESQQVQILFSDGSKLNFHHWQDCCEWVCLYDFELTTSLDKIIGGVINDAREDGRDATNDDNECTDESGYWTFYNINTSRGCINMRWLGQSNGYYSEDVSVEFWSR